MKNKKKSPEDYDFIYLGTEHKISVTELKNIGWSSKRIREFRKERNKTMTNYERWLSYTEPLPSPQNYIQWSWLYTVAASLQRRVWCPPSHDPLYPNMFVIYVGEPGIGKGAVIRAQTSILSHFTLGDIKPNTDNLSDKEKYGAEKLHEQQLKKAQDEADSTNHQNGEISKALLFPDAPDATTYEALVQSMSRSIRYIQYKAHDEKQQKDVMKVYGHSSMHFSLEELASIMRKNTESLTNFLIQTYDCGENYRYKTKTGGEDRIFRVCLNFSAGTTPDFMQNTFDEKLTNQGFSSRTFFIFALKNRKSVFFRPELTPEQKQHKKEILDHVAKLACLHGQVDIDLKTRIFLQEWICKHLEDATSRSSQSPKLKAYYPRKNIHVMKVAMALHFGESTDMHIPLSTFERAIELLHEEEKSMSLALMVGNANPLAKPAHRITDYLSVNGKRTFKELLAEFWGEIRKPELEEIISFLQQTDRVCHMQETDEVTKLTETYYYVKK